MSTYGIVLGRFQPLHHGHVEYLNVAKERCKRLFIGITNPDASVAKINQADSKRSLAENNPFSYIDRHLMIERSLIELGWASDSFCVIAAPVTDPSRLVAYLPSPAKSEYFVTIYDDWGEQKARELVALGYPVEILWRRTHEERFTSGTFIRNAIRNSEPWEHLVPRGVFGYVMDNNLIEAL